MPFGENKSFKIKNALRNLESSVIEVSDPVTKSVIETLQVVVVRDRPNLLCKSGKKLKRHPCAGL